MESRIYDSVFDPVYTTRANLSRSVGKPLYRATAAAISGGQRTKFFRRPIVPFLHVSVLYFLVLSWVAFYYQLCMFCHGRFLL